MIPVHLHISGFLSYLDPVDVDFTGFDLACISGSNGAGKSSLLDAMTWSLFGEARRSDDTVINTHKDVKAAEVVFDFSYESNLYRVMRSKPRDKTTVLEFFIASRDEAGNVLEWRSMTEKSMRETERRIKSTLRMDYDTFINASFLLQGRADQFSQQRPGDRKKVLSAILGLEVWEQYRADASERRRGVEALSKSIDAQMVEVDAELAEEDARKSKLAEIEVRLEHAIKQRTELERSLDAMRRLALSLEQQGQMVEMMGRSTLELRQRFERLEDEHHRLVEEQAGFQRELAREAEVQAAFQNWQNLRVELERWEGVAANFREIEATRAAPRTIIAAEEARLSEERRALFAQEMGMLQERERLPGLEAQLAQAAEAMERLQTELAGRAELEADLRTVQGSAAEAQVENRTLRAEMLALKERITQLQHVEGALCPLCGQPLSESERGVLIAQLEQEGKEMGDRHRANQDLQAQSDGRVRDLQNRIAGLARFDEELRGQSRLHDRLEAERQRVQTALESWESGGAARLAEVSDMLAEERYALEARAELAEIDARSKALGYDAAAHDEVRQAEQEGRKSEAQLRSLEAARASLAPVERQIAALETQISQEAANLAEQERAYRAAREKYEAECENMPDVDAQEKEVYSLQADENRLRMEMGMARQRVAVLDVQRERRTRLAAQRSDLTLQVTRLKTLEKAFSKDGVPALLIEQALPEIEMQANDLLDRLSGGAMSVRFETQRQYKDKSRDDRKETLDILISDASGPREYELFSGGEAFRVNFAIRLALSRVLAQRAGARLQTLVIDEGFGSQDAEGRQRLVEAINLVREDFQKILVITHLEELKDAFSARIEVEKTPRGSRVTVLT